ncbi:MAG TPA: guanylate kinase [Burkholderiaceae bacterium]|nr:guanylate kinase [Burkholderiaceae bacterium]
MTSSVPAQPDARLNPGSRSEAVSESRDALPAAGSGSVFLIVAPSGAGKTSLVKAMLERRPQMELSVSFTTRPPRPGESDGIHYHFVTREDFMRRRDNGEFLEWAQVHDNYYATSRDWIAQRVAAGRDIVLEIDWQGATQVQRLLPAVVGIFIAPPSVAELRARLTRRGQDASEVIERRVAAAEIELQQAHRFEYVIINESFDVALTDLLIIVDGAGLRFAQQQARHPELFRQLLRGTPG